VSVSSTQIEISKVGIWQAAALYIDVVERS
jgi:hypothetical protein